jgi:hypothetical protein
MIDAYLKPCRNCHHETPRRIFGFRVGTNVNMYRIICDNCDNASEIYSDEQGMIDAWNLRPIESEARESVVSPELVEQIPTLLPDELTRVQ